MMYFVQKKIICTKSKTLKMKFLLLFLPVVYSASYTVMLTGAVNIDHYTVTADSDPSILGGVSPSNDPTITINEGDTITFVNNAGTSHPFRLTYGATTLAVDDTQTGSLIFDIAGSYTYYCLYHPSMTGTIVVNPSSTSSSASSPSPPPPSPPPPSPSPPPASGSVAQDPHLRLPNGGIADFRGKNNTLYNFLTSSQMNVNVKTEDASFVLKRNVNDVVHTLMVHGSFITEIHVHSGDLKLSIRASESSSTQKNRVQGTCLTKPFDILSFSDIQCGSSSIVTKYSSAVINTPNFKITIRTNKVYNRVKGPLRRLDLSFTRTNKVKVHGIIGQSFDKPYTNGKQDVYPLDGEYTTKAMAEGAIDGTADLYEMKEPFSTKYQYALFENVNVNEVIQRVDEEATSSD